MLTGAGMVLAGLVVLPMLKGLRQTVSVTQLGAGVAGEELRRRFSFVREEAEDFWAEVQFERFRRQIDREMGSETQPDE